MKILAYLGNVALLTWIITATSDSTLMSGKEILIAALFLAVPLINIIVLAKSGKEQDFLSLYFERKRLEQKKMIDTLQDSVHRES
jgi:hypothetical protein